MTFKIENEMLDAMRDEPRFLRVTPEGLDDGETLHDELIVKPTDATIVVKLFEHNELVHTSEDCNSDPNCPQCNDRRARRYFRLQLDVDGRQYSLDVPPSAARRFQDLARDGIDGLLKLTCTSMERRGRTWGDLSFEIVKEAA